MLVSAKKSSLPTCCFKPAGPTVSAPRHTREKQVFTVCYTYRCSMQVQHIGLEEAGDLSFRSGELKTHERNEFHRSKALCARVHPASLLRNHLLTFLSNLWHSWERPIDCHAYCCPMIVGCHSLRLQ